MALKDKADGSSLGVSLDRKSLSREHLIPFNILFFNVTFVFLQFYFDKPTITSYLSFCSLTDRPEDQVDDIFQASILNSS